MLQQQALTFRDLPEPVALFLVGVQGLADAKEFLHRFSPVKKTAGDVLSLVEHIVLHHVSLADLPSILKEWGIAPSNEAAIFLANKRLLPIAPVVGDVASCVRTWGAVPDAQVKAVITTIAPLDFAATLETTKRFSENPLLHQRFVSNMARVLTAQMSIEEFVTLAVRGEKVGGLDMSEADAQEAVALAKEKKKAYVFEVQASVKAQTPAIQPASVPSAPVPVEEKQTAQVKPQQPPKIDVKEFPEPKRIPEGKRVKIEPARIEAPKVVAKPAARPLEKASEDEEMVRMRKIADEMAKRIKPAQVSPAILADELIGKFQIGFSPEQRQQFVSILDSRLRDVRDAFETRAALERPREQGGLGLVGENLANVMQAIEAAAATTPKTIPGPAKQKPPLPPKADLPPAQTLTKAPSPLTTNPSPVASANADKVGQFEGGQTKVEEIRRAISHVEVSAPTLPKSQTHKPKVEDIRFVRKLIGPVEELRGLTLAEFRRIANEPTQAASKVLEKIDLLEQQEGFEKRVAAVRAWRTSPLYLEFSDCLQKALTSSGGMDAVLGKGSEMKKMTREEFQAIMDMNRELRF